MRYPLMCVTQTNDHAELSELLAPYDHDLEVEMDTDDDGQDYWYNPNGKFQGWLAGGQFQDFLILKDGSVHYRSQIKDINFSSKELKNTTRARYLWKMMDDTFRNLPKSRSYYQIAAEEGATDQPLYPPKEPSTDRLLAIHRSQPRYIAARSLTKDLFPEINLTNPVMVYEANDESSFVTSLVLKRILPSAFLSEEFGWISSSDFLSDPPTLIADKSWRDEELKAKIEMKKFISETIKQYDPDDWVTIVDCWT